MEPGEKVLSDVHLYHTCECLSTKESNSVTRFVIKLQSSDTDEIGDNAVSADQDSVDNTGHREVITETQHIPSCLEVDEDGDLILQRDGNSFNSEDTAVITLEHSLATELQDVGEQVWAGALLLCDFLLHHETDFCQKSVLDLGAGTGLTTIVAAMLAKTVYCTDVGESVLRMAHHNVEINADLTSNCHVVVRELDWCKGLHVQGKGNFRLSEVDITDILQAEVIIAADVIYDDDLTDALFKTIHLLLSKGPPKTVYMGLEKRLVFTLSDLDVVCPAYTHFYEGLVRLQQLGCEGRQFHYFRLDEDLPMYLNYNRTKQLEIWAIQSVIPNG
ncbi:methyltransferase-like protein 22 [Ylistrum balloti]|uniref:methyltransferase-like protein 22 n=1 Tax=Ylistrum balloti TaxID=509963 RepID=UPI002905C63A|nr:methyltransferase-like protein 22 [Ylistrum balloti]